MLYIYAIIRENEGDRRKSVPESIKQNMEGSRVEEERYLISDAARIVEVEAHVLRYWEEELETSHWSDRTGTSILHPGKY